MLHFADNASAKTASMADALTDADNFTGEAPGQPRGSGSSTGGGRTAAAATGERHGGYKNGTAA